MIEEQEIITFGKKENSMLVPTSALMSFGVYTRPPLPTVTWMVVPSCAVAVATTAARVTRADERYIIAKSVLLLKTMKTSEL